MSEKGKAGGFGLSVLWFGAAVSLAEITAGSYISPLGIRKGIFVILSGHLIGCLILAFVGIIGFREKKPSLISSRMSLGKYGSYMVSIFNIIQLLGWTAVMLILCTKAIQSITFSLFGINNFALLVIIVGVLVGIWALNAEKGINIINNTAVVLLAILSVVMLVAVLKGNHAKPVTSSISFGSALELSIVMPLSWVPLISDYTMRGISQKGSFFGSFFGYFIGSSFMYVIGLITSAYTGASDPIGILNGLNMGFAALMVVILATVTTTFLDVYSAVLSTINLTGRISRKRLIIIFTAAGTLMALFFPMDQYQNFLYFIGSLFAPVFTVILIDYFIYKKDRAKLSVNITGITSALVGTISYYIISRYDLIFGSTVPSMIITALLYVVMRAISNLIKKGEDKYVEQNS